MTLLSPSRYTNTASSLGPDIVYDVSRTILSRLSLSDALLARRISSVWKADVDGLMEGAWKAVRKGAGSPTSSQSLAGMIAHVTKEAFNACPLEHLENCPLGQEVSACELFGRLSQLFKKTYGIELDLTRSLDSLAEQIQELQIKQQPIHDRDLRAVWPEMRAKCPSAATLAPPPAAAANEIRAWMMESANLPYLASITSLDLENLFLKTIPSEIGQLSQLSYLGLSNNKIVNIPSEIGQLSQLSYLGLSNNKIAHIPSEIGQLSQLSYLGLSNNKIAHIPDEIGQLFQLSSLNLSHNQIAHIPDAIGKLSQLSYLNLSNNQITSIPDAIGQISQLSELYLEKNPILCIARAVLTSDRTQDNISIKIFTKALQWEAKSPLAQLCLAIMQDGERAMKQMPTLLSNLSPEERTGIFFYVEDLHKRPQTEGAQWGKRHALDDPELFMRVVYQSIVGHLKTLSQKQRDVVYRKIGQWADQSETGALWWGQVMATENLPRLADALTESENNPSQST